MTGAANVRLVVLNYEGGDHVLRCLESLFALDYPAESLEIVVVDNASTDGSADAIAERFPTVDLRRMPTNTGFGANNEALVDLDGIDYVGLINNDAYPEPSYLSPLVGALAEGDDRLGAVCPKILFDRRFHPIAMRPNPAMVGEAWLDRLEIDGVDRLADCHMDSGRQTRRAGDGGLEIGIVGECTLWVPALGPRTALARIKASRPIEVEVGVGEGLVVVDAHEDGREVILDLGAQAVDLVNNAGSELVSTGSGRDRGYLCPDGPDFAAETDVFAWCGAGVLFRPEYLADVGMFDERFFLYYEDLDLSWRGRRMGWHYRYIPTSVMRHSHATTTVEGSPLFNYYQERNRIAIMLKNASPPFAAKILVRSAAKSVAMAGRAVLPGRAADRRTLRRRLRSQVDAIRIAPAMLRTRREIKTGARLSAGEAQSAMTQP